MVQAILDDVVVENNGTQYIDNYASWAVQLRAQRHTRASRVFVQLSVLADQFLKADCKSVAGSLAVLARIGLPHACLPRRTASPITA